MAITTFTLDGTSSGSNTLFLSSDGLTLELKADLMTASDGSTLEFNDTGLGAFALLGDTGTSLEQDATGLGSLADGSDEFDAIDGLGDKEVVIMSFSQTVTIISAEIIALPNSVVGNPANQSYRFLTDSNGDGALDTISGNTVYSGNPEETFTGVTDITAFGLGAQSVGDSFRIASITVEFTPIPTSDFTLVQDVAETGDWGNKFNGTTDEDGSIIATFEGTTEDLVLTFDGYDIDNGSEVELFLNGTSLGFLDQGVNNGLANYSFTIPAADQLVGDNEIEFVQSTPNFKWGFTNVLLAAAPTGPQVDFALVLDVPETGEFGNNFNGTTDEDGSILASFTGTTADLDLTFEGYDIDNASEVELFLNGTSLGFLAKGVNNGLADYSFTIPAADQLVGENIIEFVQTTPSYKWGLTNLLVSPTPTGPQPDFTLTQDVQDSTEYGNKYNGATDEDGVIIAEFTGTSGDLELSFKGFDIDNGSEIEVLLNGVSKGFLDAGANNGLADYTIEIAAAEQVAGQNLISFVQTTPQHKWGITDLLLEEPAAADILLTQDVLDSTDYGNKYNGTTDADGVITAAFTGTTENMTLDFKGYDIDNGAELEILLNGVSKGFIDAGVNNGLADYQIEIVAAEQIAGTNIISFVQSTPNYKWGITDLLLEEGTPDVPTDITLTQDVLETGEFGNQFNLASDADGIITAGFEGTDGNLILNLQGFDIDFVNEVEVLLNGVSKGGMGRGVNGALDDFTIDIGVEEQIAGQNILTFVQSVPANQWGLTNLLLVEGAPISSTTPDAFTVSAKEGNTTLDVLENDVAIASINSVDLDVDDDGTNDTLGTVTIDGTELIYNPGTAFESLAAGATATETFQYTATGTDGVSYTETVALTIEQGPLITVTFDLTGTSPGGNMASFAEGGLTLDVVADWVLSDDGDEIEFDDVGFGVFELQGDVLTQLTLDNDGLGALNQFADLDTGIDGFGHKEVTIFDFSEEVDILSADLIPFANSRNPNTDNQKYRLYTDSDNDGTLDTLSANLDNAEFADETVGVTGTTVGFGVDRGLDSYKVASITVQYYADLGATVADAIDVGEDDGLTTLDVLGNDTAMDVISTLDLDVDDDGTNDTLGTISIAADGESVTYDPGTLFDSLNTGETATETFTYTATGLDGTSYTETAVITIVGADEIPPGTTAPDAVTFAEDAPNTLVDVLANDSAIASIDSIDLDVDDDGTDDTLGLVTIAADGLSVSYDPNGEFDALETGQTATEEFQYSATGLDGLTYVETVTITIDGASEPGVAVADSFSFDEDAGASVLDVLLNDTALASINSADLDVDNDGTNDTIGLVTVAADGLSITYNPNGNFDALNAGETATEQFEYSATGLDGISYTALVDITINGIDDPA